LYELVSYDDLLKPHYFAFYKYSFCLGDNRRKYVNLYFNNYVRISNINLLSEKIRIIIAYEINHEQLTQGYNCNLIMIKNRICQVIKQIVNTHINI
jgi:hypothetical protein